jgi:hypothetical protein
MTLQTFAVALTSIMLSAIAQLLIKVGMSGVAGDGASTARRSLAYPSVSLGFVVVALLSWIYLRDQLPHASAAFY